MGVPGGEMGEKSGAGTRPGKSVGAVVVGTGPDVAGIGPVEDVLLWTLLAGHPMVSWSLRALAGVQRISEIVLLVAPGREAAVAQLEAQFDLRVTVLPATAGDSLLAGLEILSPRCDLILFHYGNRPLISASSINRGITVAEEHPGSGVVASEPVRDTIKRADSSLVVETPPRSELVLLQSPQIYPRDLIRVYLAQQASAEPVPRGATYPELVWMAAGLPLLPFYFSGENDREGLIVSSEDDLLLAEVSLGERG